MEEDGDKDGNGWCACDITIDGTDGSEPLLFVLISASCNDAVDEDAMAGAGSNGAIGGVAVNIDDSNIGVVGVVDDGNDPNCGDDDVGAAMAIKAGEVSTL
jgi:hypothetical protein